MWRTKLCHVTTFNPLLTSSNDGRYNLGPCGQTVVTPRIVLIKRPGPSLGRGGSHINIPSRLDMASKPLSNTAKAVSVDFETYPLIIRQWEGLLEVQRHIGWWRGLLNIYEGELTKIW